MKAPRPSLGHREVPAPRPPEEGLDPATPTGSEALGIPAAGLTTGAGHLGAVQALRASLGRPLFWSPLGIGQLPREAQESWVRRVVEPEPFLREVLREAQVTRLREESAALRIKWANSFAYRSGVDGRPSRNLEESFDALCWAVGVSRRVVTSYLDKSSVGPSGSLILSGDRDEVCWIPDQLHLHGRAVAARSGLCWIGRGLEVGGSVIFEDCPNLTELPAGMKVGHDLSLAGCPIRELPDDLEVGGNIAIYETALSRESIDRFRASGRLKGQVLG